MSAGPGSGVTLLLVDQWRILYNTFDGIPRSVQNTLNRTGSLLVILFIYAFRVFMISLFWYLTFFIQCKGPANHVAGPITVAEHDVKFGEPVVIMMNRYKS